MVALTRLTVFLISLLAWLASAQATNLLSWVPLPTYTLTELWLGSAEAINDRGDVAGVNTIVAAPILGGHAVLYKGGHLLYLDALLGLPAGTYSLATSLNLAGQAVGYFFDNSTIGSSGGSAVTSFLYANGRIQTFKVDNLDTWAFGINNFGQVAGTFASSGLVSYAYLRQPNGAISRLDIFGSSDVSVAGTNDWGQVAGSFSDTNGYSHAFLTQAGGTAPKDLGINADAVAVNDLGQVTGFSWQASPPPVPYHAFLYTGGKMRDLGTLGGPNSFGFGLNNFGQVVGYSETQPTSQGWHGFVYLQGQMRDLNGLLSPTAHGWTVVVAHSINDWGQIVAEAVNAQGENHAVLLTPYY